MSAAGTRSDIRTLVAQLNQPSTTDHAAREILETAAQDPDARAYVAQHLPAMIDSQRTDQVWLNAVRLAGQLKVTEAIPSLEKSLSRGPVGGPMQTSFTKQMRLEDDAVGKALSQIGEPAIPAATNLLNNGDPKRRRRAVLILTNMHSPASRKVLRDHFPHETDPIVRSLIEAGLRS